MVMKRFVNGLEYSQLGVQVAFEKLRAWHAV